MQQRKSSYTQIKCTCRCFFLLIIFIIITVIIIIPNITVLFGLGTLEPGPKWIRPFTHSKSRMPFQKVGIKEASSFHRRNRVRFFANILVKIERKGKKKDKWMSKVVQSFGSSTILYVCKGLVRMMKGWCLESRASILCSRRVARFSRFEVLEAFTLKILDPSMQKLSLRREGSLATKGTLTRRALLAGSSLCTTRSSPPIRSSRCIILGRNVCTLGALFRTTLWAYKACAVRLLY